MKYFRDIQQLEIVSTMQISGFFFQNFGEFFNKIRKMSRIYKSFEKVSQSSPRFCCQVAKTFQQTKTQFLLLECVDCIPPFCEL
jgi:hypothetical protein